MVFRRVAFSLVIDKIFPCKFAPGLHSTDKALSVSNGSMCDTCCDVYLASEEVNSRSLSSTRPAAQSLVC